MFSVNYCTFSVFWKGTVTEFKHPSDFYVQLYSSEVLEYMNLLSASLKETYANTAQEEDYLPVKGEVCVAKYTVDQVTFDEMNYLIQCFNLLWSYKLDTRAFNNAFAGLTRGCGHIPLSRPQSVLWVCWVTPSSSVHRLLCCRLQWWRVRELVFIFVAEALVCRSASWARVTRE